MLHFAAEWLLFRAKIRARWRGQCVASDKRDGEEMEGPLNKPIPLPPFFTFEGNIMLSLWRFYVAIAALPLQGCDLR